MLIDKPFTDQLNPELDNPLRLGNESAAENLAAVHHSTFAHLHDEMKGRVHINQDSVWTQLRVDDVEAELVRTCSRELRTACAKSVEGLQEIVLRKYTDKTSAENKMYPFLVRPLCDIFDEIGHSKL